MDERPSTSQPTSSTTWSPLDAQQVRDLLSGVHQRWWLSGDAALHRWLGQPLPAERVMSISVVPSDLRDLCAALPPALQPWAASDGSMTPLTQLPADADIQWVDVYDPQRDAWLLRIHVEDGWDKAWLYRRDPRVQRPWDEAVIDLDGVPTGAPEIQLLWKALRPTPDDDRDRELVLPTLGDAERAWLEQAILRVHLHSSWAIQRRSPMNPARASWQRRG